MVNFKVVFSSDNIKEKWKLIDVQFLRSLSVKQLVYFLKKHTNLLLAYKEMQKIDPFFEETKQRYKNVFRYFFNDVCKRDMMKFIGAGSAHYLFDSKGQFEDFIKWEDINFYKRNKKSIFNLPIEKKKLVLSNDDYVSCKSNFKNIYIMYDPFNASTLYNFNEEVASPVINAVIFMNYLLRRSFSGDCYINGIRIYTRDVLRFFTLEYVEETTFFNQYNSSIIEELSIAATDNGFSPEYFWERLYMVFCAFQKTKEFVINGRKNIQTLFRGLPMNDDVIKKIDRNFKKELVSYFRDFKMATEIDYHSAILLIENIILRIQEEHNLLFSRHHHLFLLMPRKFRNS
ncbi:hypothetical protein ACFL56_02080 [Candidatus Margulisiibacteriota bacterium]